MDKTWFHLCLTGLLGLSAIRKEDVKAILQEHPNQANMRMVLALKASNQKQTKGKVVFPDAFYLPDRKALFLQDTFGQYGLAKPVAEQTSPLSTPAGNTRQSSSQLPIPGRIVPLPQYTPPEIATEELEKEEDEIEGLERRLLAGLAEEEFSRDWEAVGPLNTSSLHREEPPVRRPIMDRFDSEMSRINEAPALHPPLPAFLDWLQKLPTVPPDHFPLDVEEESPDSGGNNTDRTLSEREHGSTKPSKKESKKAINEEVSSRKQKKKQKKLAKKLAKESIRANQEVASETLAALLASQGHTYQAIAMYDRLSLLFPEKKSTFAGQIAKLKRKDP